MAFSSITVLILELGASLLARESKLLLASLISRRTMNMKAILLLCAANAVYHFVHPFQLLQQTARRHLENNQGRRLLTQVNVGFGYGPQDWSDVKPNKNLDNNDDNINSPPSLSLSKQKQRPLNAIESLWTKYGMIAYVAHMCAFLPLSLVPTFLQTKLGMLSKSESEHQALQVGQKCAQTLLQWIPFMNVGKFCLFL